MPSKYLVKDYAEESFYHVFNRGVEKRNIFQERSDYLYFLELFNRYLGPERAVDKVYRKSPNYHTEIELAAYCLMPNHFHLMVYQNSDDSMQKLMRSLLTAYSMYFNKKYKRVGSLFQDRYKAVLIDDEPYYAHITRYIHLNPLDIGQDYLKYPFSSLGAWVNSSNAPPWLKPDRAKGEFASKDEYLEFLAYYKDIKGELQEIKLDLKE